MKAKILNTQEQIELPQVFSSQIRKDIVDKVYNAMFKKQRYTNYPLAGKQSSTGKQSHTRRKFKTTYGKGISRVPKKALWRRGDQFYWVGTFTPETVKGHPAHPPKLLRRQRVINKKERTIAIKSCIAATASQEIIKKNYTNPINASFPIIIKSSLLEKPKEFMKELKSNKIEIMKERKIRPGKGKVRGRRYKNTRKAVLIISDKEKSKLNNLINHLKVSHINVHDLSLNGKPGKLAIYTENAIKEMGNKFK